MRATLFVERNYFIPNSYLQSFLVYMSCKFSFFIKTNVASLTLIASVKKRAMI